MSAMTSEPWDVVVIGAGINGAGVAQAAAAAGYRCLVLEKNDQPALETSSRSSKLIHGGLRYLESFEIPLVYESLKERELLIRLAPGLVRRQTFHIPVYRDTRRAQWELYAGLGLYALMAGPVINRFRRIGKKEAQSFPGLEQRNLKAVFQYQDAQTDDAALTRAVLDSARSLGAESLFRSEMIAARRTASIIELDYRQDGKERSLQTRCLVNAAGPWVYGLNQRIDPPPPMRRPDLVQGAHLVLEETIDRAWYLEAPQDGRAVFLLPWKGHALLGTTETLYQGDPAEVHCLPREREYLLQVQAHYFPQRGSRVLEEMAGLRVLPAAEGALFKRSRETVYVTDDRRRPRIVNIVGGKLTVYRKSAEKVIDLLAGQLPPRKRKARTDRLFLGEKTA
jgi:glycerol-3-phosphate dehydrogenase